MDPDLAEHRICRNAKPLPTPPPLRLSGSGVWDGAANLNFVNKGSGWFCHSQTIQQNFGTTGLSDVKTPFWN